MTELENYKYVDTEFYDSIKEVLTEARKRVYRNIQNEMVQAYWQIGKMIIEKQGGEERAEYGEGLVRERRFDMDGRNFYVDLVLYNYKLKCFVLIDLKRGDLTHQDIGQMQMYVNYYTRELMEPGDNPPIGIVLCADKSDTLVRYTLPLDNKQIYASKYMLYLPKEEDLRNEINKQRELLEGNFTEEK